ncbi:MAG: lamin tail domain-containing protein [Bacteroidetes bacterium]|nr:lamin tail domain-containing protein [Bacteroidota bacterium]
MLLMVTSAYAQVTDNFSDGDFTANQAWTGDGAEFIVNASQQLQLNNTLAGASYLSFPNALASLDNTEWHFYISQTFAPSSSNYGRVYLVSDQANLEGSLNGYYLQFGEAGTTDAVELFRQTGLTSTSVCRGTNAQIAASFAIGIKVTRDASGNWSLFVDPAGGTAYVLQANGTDNTYTSSSFFGVATVYTVSNATKFFFDDFYIGPVIVDNTAPSIVSTTVISSTQLDVLFDEAVDLTTAQTAGNYSVNNGIGNPASAVRDASNFALVHLTFATAFSNALLNTLTVSNVQDQSANAITTATSNFTYFAPVTAAYKDVIITEIYADPSPQVALPATEFVELFNRSSNTLNLNGWKFTDGSSTATFGNYNLAPNQYLIICPVADTASYSVFGAVMGVSSFPSLNNTGDNLKLKDNTLVDIDSVNYSDAWYQDAIKLDGGWTLELINPNIPLACAASANWIASNNVNGGTPGVQNSVFTTAADVTAPSVVSVTATDPLHVSVCFSEAVSAAQLATVSNFTINNSIGTPQSAVPNGTLTCVELTLSNPLTSSTNYTLTFGAITDCAGNNMNPLTANFSYYEVKHLDVVFNEIMADPDPIFSSLPNYEYVELYNRTAFPINLNNWKFIAGTNVKLLPDVTILPDSFIVFASTTAAPNYPASYNVVGVTSFPTLTNSGQALTLKTANDLIISTVTYSDAWYGDDTKKDGGWSLEQIDPNNPCAGASNWTASVSADAGTPGRQNSVFAANPDLVLPEIERISVISADTIQVFFTEPMDSLTLMSTTLFTVDNGFGNPVYARSVAPDFKSVILAFTSPFQIGTIYTLSVGDTVTDCAGNAVGTNNSARFAIPEPASPKDIVINEILVDPNSGGVDFVEIYNRSNKVIDLKTLSISQYDTILNVPINLETISADGFLFFPNEYLVLSENTAAVLSQYSTSNPKGFLEIVDLPSMNIDAGTVCLSTTSDVIDHFVYYSDMHFALLNSTKGVSLERIDFNRETNDRTNWHSASKDVGYATPAYKNSQYTDAGEAESAIEITPEIFSPDEDGYNDVVNINYHFDQPGFVANVSIYDSKGRMIRYLIRNELLGTKGTFSWDGITEEKEKARIGIYIVFFEVFHTDGAVKKYKKTCVLGGKL